VSRRLSPAMAVTTKGIVVASRRGQHRPGTETAKLPPTLRGGGSPRGRRGTTPPGVNEEKRSQEHELAVRAAPHAGRIEGTRSGASADGGLRPDRR